MELEAVIGLEIHAQVNTHTKMFCRCDNDAFGKVPNSCICPVCTAQPGALPVPNGAAVEKALKAGLALGCQIRAVSKFDRKNYFYPDLPTGYQISQFDEPFTENGAIEIEVAGELKKIGITRLHLENDAGKLTHTGTSSLVDFNRAGTPLMEIVSEPDIRSSAEARAYAEAVQQIVQFVGSSNADMFKGEMRFDASVSLRPVGDDQLYPRAEIKNLNSFRALERAVEYEIARQKKLWVEDKKPESEQTVGWDDEKGETYVMREKESAADYRYFPEPDIPPFQFTPQQIEKWKSELPEMPTAMRSRFISELGLTEQEATDLTSSKDLADYFEKVVETSGDAKKSAGWVLSELLGKMNDTQISLVEQKITAENLGQLVGKIVSGEISGKIGKEIFPEMWETGQMAADIIEAKGLKMISDTGEIEKIVDEVLASNPGQLEQYRAGKEQLLGFFVGQTMKATGGQADPAAVNKILRDKLAG